MGWLWLAAAIVAEIIGTSLLKLSEGFSRPARTVLAFAFFALALTGLIHVLRYLPLSVTYAVWAGLGTALVAAVGITVFGETVSAVKILSIGLIMAGVVSLNLFGGAH
jgi:small multidrug resistance pump